MARIVAVVIFVVLNAGAGGAQVLGAQISEEALARQLETYLVDIRSASRVDLPKRVQALADAAKTRDMLPPLVALYGRAPNEDYGTRRFLVGVIGELQDPRALPFLVKVLSTNVPSNDQDSTHGFSARDEEESVLVKVVHAVGYMRSAAARELLLATISNHESHVVRVEALRSYVWNSRDHVVAAQELVRVLPESLHQFATMPNLHRDMDREAFDRALAQWRKQWSKPEP
ncbi:MAG TPA: HEAT repeat domain-containing protein [Vicinamibacterales bacterium]|jgi:hypothetical protein